MTAPPGAVLLLVAYGAGLATGLSRFPDPHVVMFAALATAATVRRDVLRLAAVALAVGAVVGSVSGRPPQGECGQTLPVGPIDLVVRLEEPSANGWIRATSLDENCRGPIRLRWPAGPRATSGALVRVGGSLLARKSIMPAPATLVATSVQILPGTSRRVRDRIHDTVLARSSALFGRRAPLVDALVTGRRAELDTDLRNAFAAAGLVHLLAISGFHVGLIAGWLLLLLRLTPLGRHAAEGSAAALALCYVAFLGWPAPAARAGWVLALVAWSRWRQRKVDAIALLASSSLLVVLADPVSVTSVGGWLSASALAGAIVLTRWSDRAIGRGAGWRTLGASLGATLGTAPIAAMVFGQVALIGIALNFIAIPLVALAVPAILVALIIVPVAPTIASAFAASGGVLLASVERLAQVGAAVPLGRWIGEPGWSSMLGWSMVLLAAWLLIHGRATARVAGRRAAWGLVSVSWVWLVIASGTVRGSGRLTLDFLDVGQGDAIAIRTPHGRWVMVDAGPAGGGTDAGKRVVVPFLRRHGARRIDVFLLSHAHRDHVGGASALARAIPVRLALEPGMTFADDSYLDWLGTLRERETRWRVARAGEHWTIDGIVFRVLHPASGWGGSGIDLNEDSIVLEVRYGDFVAVLAGDAGIPAEAVWAAEVAGATVLKVGHHGSRGATGDVLLSRLHAQAAIISLGRNRYGHPAPETLARLARAGVPVWRTDVGGTVHVSTNGHEVEVRNGRARATFELPRRTRPRRRRARTNPGDYARTIHSRPGALPS
ncbi:MAG: DNA internalization-related competence protein ComEC/Rec2 [Gemmatimonadales bacterium]